MILDSEATQHLKPWLVRTLEPICDAEPGALADYILALLKHSAPEAELRKELAAQLDEFLEKEGPPFIDTLFTAIRTKSYMPYSVASPPSGQAASSSTSAQDTGIPIPLDALLTPTSPSDRGRKRSLEHDERDGRPVKGARLGDDGRFSRYGRGSWAPNEGRGGRMMMSGRGDFMDGGMGSTDLGMGGPGMNGRGTYRPPEQKRGICRDYHNNGYCARGAYCKYSHGDDAVVPGQLFPLNGGMPGGAGPYGQMMAGNGMAFPMGANTPYNPHERIDMHALPGGSTGMGMGRVMPARPALIRPGDMNGARKPGELPVIQDLTPVLPQDEGRPMQGSLPDGGVGSGSYDAMAVDTSLPPNPMGNGGRGGFRRQRDGPHGRGTFNGEAANFRPERRGDKTLVVEKIPEDKLSLGAINDWFKKFGTVTNVAVDVSSSKALVSFSNHEEAYAAWKSEEAVFNNRFVKVFWHRPMEGHGQLGSRMLAASANLVAKVSAKDTSAPPPGQANASATSASSTPHKTPSTTASQLAAKQHLLEQQIGEQKTLMAKLSSASAEEKKAIMARLRKLNEEMKPPSSTAPPKDASPTPAKHSRGGSPRSEEQLRERLDKELELHHAVTAAEDEGEAEGEESTEELKARLEKLKAEAASLGITEGVAESAPHYGGGYRPYRGRGRGRGRGFYSRGGPPRASMKLDNRPKKLLVKGATAEQLQAVRDWYETTGQLDSADMTADGDIVVAFRSRSAAEQGLAKGSNLATVGPVSISWFTGQPQATTSTTNGHTPAPAAPHEEEPTALTPDVTAPDASDMVEDSHVQEEEIDSGGWGGDDFGML